MTVLVQVGQGKAHLVFAAHITQRIAHGGIVRRGDRLAGDELPSAIGPVERQKLLALFGAALIKLQPQAEKRTFAVAHVIGRRGHGRPLCPRTHAVGIAFFAVFHGDGLGKRAVLVGMPGDQRHAGSRGGFVGIAVQGKMPCAVFLPSIIGHGTVGIFEQVERIDGLGIFLELDVVEPHLAAERVIGAHQQLDRVARLTFDRGGQTLPFVLTGIARPAADGTDILTVPPDLKDQLRSAPTERRAVRRGISGGRIAACGRDREEPLGIQVSRGGRDRRAADLDAAKAGVALRAVPSRRHGLPGGGDHAISRARVGKNVAVEPSDRCLVYRAALRGRGQLHPVARVRGAVLARGTVTPALRRTVRLPVSAHDGAHRLQILVELISAGVARPIAYGRGTVTIGERGLFSDLGGVRGRAVRHRGYARRRGRVVGDGQCICIAGQI